MKNKLHLLILPALILTLIACSKDEENSTDLVTEEEAATLVEASVSSRSGGAVATVTDVSATAESVSGGPCNLPGDTTISVNGVNAFASYTYSNNLSWLLECNNLGAPLQLTFNTTATAGFDAERWDGTSESMGSLVLTGLQPQQMQYTANGAMVLDGTVTGSLRQRDPSLQSSLDLALINLTIRKSDQYITGGTGNFTLTVTNGAGQSQMISGSIVFNGDGTATISIGNRSYTITL